MDEEKIKKEAKALMDDFMSALEKAPKVDETVGFERDVNTREPKIESEEGFTQRVLKNAPKKKDNFILAEKKSW